MDRDKSFDAMFQSVRFAKELGTNAPADQAAVIKSMFSQQLDYAPGERYAYSNFGYCLLGRVIEKLSGQTYESYVRDHVLAPILRPLLPRLIIPIRACCFVRNRLT